VVLEKPFKAVLLVFGHPFSLEMDLTGRLTLKLDFKPFVNTICVDKRRQLCGSFADMAIAAYVFVKYLEVQFITVVVNFNIEILALPLRLFASVSLDCGFPLLLSR
jgi:hypothetical protein